MRPIWFICWALAGFAAVTVAAPFLLTADEPPLFLTSGLGILSLLALGGIFVGMTMAWRERADYPRDLAFGAAAIVAVVALGAGCGVAVAQLSGNPADVQAVQDEIESWLSDELDDPGVVVTADCPDELEIEPGREFDCSVDVTGYDTMRVTGRWQNDAGEYFLELA